MGKYYIHTGEKEEGPFDKEELRAKVVKATTMVWAEGMGDWTEAGKVDDLKDLFTSPPPFKAAAPKPPPLQTAPPASPPRKSNPVWKWLRIGTGVALLMVLVVALVNQNGSGHGSPNYHEQVMTVEETERADPARFLKAEGTYRTNFWGDQMVIEGTIVSTATVANFKDVVVRVALLSETDTELERENYVIYQRFPAHGRTDFTLRVKRSKAAKKVNLDVVGATPL